LSELQERVTAFDAVVEHTLNALRDPEVVHRLGGLAIELEKATEGLFMPYIQRGMATIPPHLQDTDRFPLIPHTANDTENGLRLDETFLEPTAGRYRQVVKAAAKRWEVGLPVAQSEMDLLIGSLYENGNKIKAPNMAVSKGTNGTLIIKSPVVDLSYRTRPSLHIPISRIMSEHPNRVAGTLAHEVVHAIDSEARIEPGFGQQYKAYTELRGYRVGAVIRQVGGVLEGDGMTEFVEQLRVEHNDDTSPFATSNELVQKLEELGVLG
jgi:hypothetical protein